MTSLQVKGPTKGDPALVSYHKTYLRSQGQLSTELLVTIRLGKTKHTDSPKHNGEHALRHGTYDEDGEAEMDEIEDETEEEVEQGPVNRPLDFPAPTATDTNTNTTATNAITNENTNNVTNETTNENANNATNASATNASADESDLEILEVRVAQPPPIHELAAQYTAVWGMKTDDTTDSDNDLSSLDDVLNQTLMSSVTEPTQTVRVEPPVPIHTIFPKFYKPVKVRTLPAPPGYRTIPPNLVNTIQRELNLFFDTGEDDGLEVVGKVIFSLKDPYSATKIRLPVKATTCRHFECFDFENFCVFHKLPYGVKGSLKKGLLMKSSDLRRLEQLFLRQQLQIASGRLLFKSPGLVYPLFSEHGQMFFTELYSRTPPLYKCPLCDEKFGLKQLYISDIFNFFVKTTPLHTTRIELVELDRYKIVEDDAGEQKHEDPDVVVLSGDESDAEPVKTEEVNKSMSEDFNDGLDDVLTKMGDGSWGNPVTLD